MSAQLHSKRFVCSSYPTGEEVLGLIGEADSEESGLLVNDDAVGLLVVRSEFGAAVVEIVITPV